MVNYIRVSGRTASGKNIESYYKTGSIRQAESEFLSKPVDEDGVASWSSEELEDLPVEKVLTCPKCSHEYPDPKAVHLFETTKSSG